MSDSSASARQSKCCHMYPWLRVLRASSSGFSWSSLLGVSIWKTWRTDGLYVKALSYGRCQLSGRWADRLPISTCPSPDLGNIRHNLRPSIVSHSTQISPFTHLSYSAWLMWSLAAFSSSLMGLFMDDTTLPTQIPLAIVGALTLASIGWICAVHWTQNEGKYSSPLVREYRA
jgi:hypothetical protein